jgi:RNA polymerase sigma-70 factor (ECF subfamily)
MEEEASTEAKKSIQMEKDFLVAFDEHSDALFRHCFVRLRDREIAKDVVQETFAKTWDYLAKGKKVDHMRAFLYRVANNLIVDTVRRKRSVSLDNMIEADGFEVKDETTTDPGNVSDGRMAVKLLESLDEIYRTVVTMRFIDGLSPKEIAQALNISENVVSVRLYRGVERLKGIVDQQRFHT